MKDAPKRLRESLASWCERSSGYGYSQEDIAKALSLQLVDMVGKSYGVLKIIIGDRGKADEVNGGG